MNPSLGLLLIANELILESICSPVFNSMACCCSHCTKNFLKFGDANRLTCAGAPQNVTVVSGFDALLNAYPFLSVRVRQRTELRAILSKQKR